MAGLFAILMMFILVAPTNLSAADKSNDKAAAKDSSDSAKDAEKSDEKKEEEKDPEPNYELPEDADVAELETFVQDLQSFRPKTRQAAMAHRSKSARVVNQAVEQILELLEEEGDDESKKYLKWKRMSISGSLSKMRSSATRADLKSFLGFYKKLGEDITPADAQTAVMAGYYLSGNQRIEDDTKVKFFGDLAGALRGSEKLSDQADMLEGIARRANLIGQELELAGTKMGGEEFGIKQLRGKVVLVDFWATWCGPCVREHPNIEANYEKFHELGFEVVGVSLDRDRDRLEKFLEDHETPWTVLHDDGGKNKATTRYGVLGIPSMFLLDQDGKVVSTTARGPELGKQLVKLLGEPVEKEEVAEETDEEEKSDSK